MYDLVIPGAGVNGGAQAMVAALGMPGIRRILVLERRGAPGLVNSNTLANANTLHFGECESNIGLEHAIHVLWGAGLLRDFIDRHLPDGHVKLGKHLIAVDGEVPALERRFAEFLPHYPDISLLGPEGIAQSEPMVMEGRDPRQRIKSLYSPNGRAVDYHALAVKYMEIAVATGKVEVRYNTEVEWIERTSQGFTVHTSNGGHESTRFLSLAAGSSSLLYSHALGYQRELAILPVAGSFYRNIRPGGGLLHGKVYTMQNPKLPWAAVHADRAVHNPDETRFGPTTNPVPLLELDSFRTFWEFLRVGTISPRGLAALLKITLDPTILGFILKNTVYDLPVIGKRVFLGDARKIIPSLTADDIALERGAGGVRGQPLNLVTGTVSHGTDRFVAPDAPFVSCMAPSPGASFSLGNAIEIAHIIGARLQLPFDEARLRADLGLPTV